MVLLGVKGLIKLNLLQYIHIFVGIFQFTFMVTTSTFHVLMSVFSLFFEVFREFMRIAHEPHGYNCTTGSKQLSIMNKMVVAS